MDAHAAIGIIFRFMRIEKATARYEDWLARQQTQKGSTEIYALDWEAP